MTKPFSLAFNLPFDEAIAAAKARKVVLPDEYYNTLPMERRRQAFTVSGLTALDQVQSVLDRLNQQLQEGGTFRDFQKWAETQSFDLPRHRLETIHRNAVQGAYNAGHWRRFEEHQDARPYLMYDAINDSRTRPAHRAMDGIIRTVDDPFWQTHSPPNGHRCRCKLISLDADQAQERSRDGNGLNRPVSPEMRADDGGWGGKPTQWSETLEAVKAKKLAKASPAIAQAATTLLNAPTLPVLASVDDFIAHGRAITAQLPHGGTDPKACFDRLIAKLEQDVGISALCVVASRGAGARLTQLASKRYPNAWTAKGDTFGPLYTKAAARIRGHQVTTNIPPARGSSVYLQGFGSVPYQQNAGYLMLRSGDVGNAVHEYAHRLQNALPGLDALFQELHRRRTAGAPKKRLKDLEPALGYRATELTREDNYTNPYQGKEYGSAMGGALEVMTMGFETVLGLTDGDWLSADRLRRFKKMYNDDREMFEFVVGLLFGWKP